MKKWMKESGHAKHPDSPETILLYDWMNKAQGKMMFYSGVLVDGAFELPVNATGYELIKLPELKWSSVFYQGQFINEKNSGWNRIKWEDRAAEEGFNYNENMYR